MTSMTWSAPTTPAVSSSTPRPSRLGFWAMRLSRRPSRFRCWKCWSTITPGSTPSPAAIWAMRCLGVAPDAPNAIMWLESALAPALVPATTAPWRNWSSTASARRVPPIVDDSRSWLPPVRKMPLALRMARAAFSSLAWARVTAWIVRPLVTPSSPRTCLYRAPASTPIDGAVEITTTFASRPPASVAKRLRMTRSRTLSSAPPMMMTDPSVTAGRTPLRDSGKDTRRADRAVRECRFMADADAPHPPELHPVPGTVRGRGRLVVDLSDVLGTPTRRRAGVYRRAIRREASRLHDHRRVIAIILLSLTFSLLAAGMIGRGEAAGADARAYWAGVRIWLNGGDPYHPTGPFLPYVYAPWMLPLFAPWALLPWDVAWVVWRGATILLLLWTIDWAYRRHALETAVVVALLGFSFGANLDLGNITMLLALLLFGAQFVGPRLAGLLWAVSTWMKWIPVIHFVVLTPRARRFGLVWLCLAMLFSIALLPQTIAQLEAIVGFGARPIRLDYLAYLWAFIPWLYRNDVRAVVARRLGAT